MADVTITVTAVTVTAGTPIERGIAGATITAGMPLYKDANANGVLKGAIITSAATAAIAGYALNGGAINQQINYVPAGAGVGTIVTMNTGLTKGVVYVVSANAGGLAPLADLASGHYMTVVGIATSTSTLQLIMQATGTAL